MLAEPFDNEIVQKDSGVAEVSGRVQAAINRAKEHVANKGKGKSVEQPWDGIFSDPQSLSKMIDALGRTAKDFDSVGAKTEAQNLRGIQKNLLTNLHNGTKILYVFDNSLTHEKLDRERYLNAIETGLRDRHGRFDELLALNGQNGRSLIDTAFDNYYFPKGYDRQYGVIVEEAATLAAEGRYGELGCTDNDAREFLKLDARSRIEKGIADAKAKGVEFNPSEFIKNHTGCNEGYDNVLRSLEKELTNERGTKESGKDNEDNAIETPRGKEEPVDRQDNPEERKQEVAACSIILGEEYYYDPQSHAETEARAQQLLDEKNVQQAVFEALNGAPSAEGMRAVYWEQERLNGLADAHKTNGNTEAYEAATRDIADLASQIVQRQVANGQETEIAKTLSVLSPEVAMMTAQKMKQYAKLDAQLTPREIEQVLDTSKELREANKILAEAEDKLK